MVTPICNQTSPLQTAGCGSTLQQGPLQTVPRQCANLNQAVLMSKQSGQPARLCPPAQASRTDNAAVTGVTSSARPSLSQPQRLPVISLISANVEADALVQAFETVAGRSAMIGFFVALGAELLTPHDQGLFGGLDNGTTSLFCANAFVLICGSALLASASKRQLGKKLHNAVLTTLVAMGHDQRQNAKGQAGVGEAIDRVFDRVLDSAFADYQLLEMDDFI